MRSFHLARLLLIAFLVLITAGISSAQVEFAISFGPPPLPIYEQPPLPAEGYIWVPGYWAFDYDYDDYYWVPGTWVLAPEPGYLWTPGYWAWNGDRFFFNEGYWGPRVGFYGGIPYGFGYPGEGYEGGRWEGERFFYNRAVNNVNVTDIHNVYNTTVVENTTVNRISYVGGEGGITARPTPQDEIAARDRHVPPVAAQTQHRQAARGNPQLRASVNRGKPPVAATPRPGAFNEHGVVAARQAGGAYHPAPSRANNEPRGGSASRPDVPRPPAHAVDVQPHQRPAPPNTGNAQLDQKYQQQQEKLYAKQQQEHQKLAQQQERDHQHMQQEQARQANQARQQEMEQRHQQQTQHMEQRHTAQQQHMQQRQQPPSHGQPPPNHEEPRPH
ncbi:MAG TPA: hypothetical protein VKB77_04585 [Terriglobales bacterium]|nr:hypothetical protein [Terriglobales bacterium]